MEKETKNKGKWKRRPAKSKENGKKRPAKDKKNGKRNWQKKNMEHGISIHCDFVYFITIFDYKGVIGGFF
jgi:hypothetical protein